MKSENSHIVSTMHPGGISDSNADAFADANRWPKFMKDDAGIAPTGGAFGAGGAKLIVEQPANNVSEIWKTPQQLKAGLKKVGK
jgi:hypothetical protein